MNTAKEIYNGLYSPGGVYWGLYSIRDIEGQGISPHYFKGANYLKGELKFPADSKILEIGCGVGWVLKILQEVGYQNVIGIDASDKAIEICGSEINAFVGDIVKTEYEDDQFDVAISIGTWEHVLKDNMTESILEFLRIAKTGVFWIDKGDDINHCFDEDEDKWVVRFQKLTTKSVRVDRRAIAQGGSFTYPILIGL